MATATDIRQQVTAKIAAALEAGTPPWRQPWIGVENTGLPANVTSRRSYSGVNPLVLSLAAVERGFRSRWWGTYRQWQTVGLRIKSRPAGVARGEWGTRVVWCQPVEQYPAVGPDEDDPAPGHGSVPLVLKQYTVFNAEQVEGRGFEAYLTADRPTAAFPEYAPAERVLAGSGADIRYGGDRAVYRPDRDYILLPGREAFAAPHDFYGTAFHELTHWTGHPARLNRVRRTARYGSTAYAREELVAEIGGCFLSAELCVPQSDDLTNQAAYLHSWLSILGNDPTAIFAAAALASAAVDYLLSPDRQPGGCNAAGPRRDARGLRQSA